MSFDRHAFRVLEVDDGDALWLAGYQAPQTRAGMYDISPDDFAKLEAPRAEAKRAAERLGLAYRFVRHGEAETDQGAAAP